ACSFPSFRLSRTLRGLAARARRGLLLRRLPRLRLPPQALARNRRAFDHGGELLEGDIGVELAIARESAEAAIGSGNHALAPNDRGEAGDALGDELGMLDIIGRGVEHAGNEDLVRRQRDLLPQPPFMRVA